MTFIKGKFKQIIFRGDTGYTVGLFKINETDDDSLETFIKKTITFTGYFSELIIDDNYKFYGEYLFHDRYGYQYKVNEYEKIIPEGKEAIIEFLTSSFIKGCGERTAKKIVDILGENAIDIIKNDINSLDQISRLSNLKKQSIYHSINKYYESNEIVLNLKTLGFSIKESMSLINKYGNSILNIIESNIYSLIDDIEFKTLDRIYLSSHEKNTTIRIMAIIIESMKMLTFNKGDTYSFKEEIIEFVKNNFYINIDENKYFQLLSNDNKIKIDQNKYYLIDYYNEEISINNNLILIDDKKIIKCKNFKNNLNVIQNELGIVYNDEQKHAIKSVFENNISIITGGPGTGKTTIINGILKMYQLSNKLTGLELNDKVALIAPTGRASKRMSETTNFGASTIHRYLKWNKENNSFSINEYNKNKHEFIIVDETSMIDTYLFDALLKGISFNVKLVLVGDQFQLPSVSPGNILHDLIESNKFTHINLDNIYRQSKNSYIPILAKEIKNKKLSSFLDKHDDYNFIECNNHDIKDLISSIANKLIKKGMDQNNLQVLAPMYKGENGIDNLNILLQNIFNPHKDEYEEVKIGNVIYRVNDKILNLVNDVEKGIYNGDIGYIYDIDINSKKDFIRVNFDNNIVSFKREELSSIKHAYAITIHKAQGSEFDNIIIPISNSYNKMLYNKLIYTGVSRAKKSLIILGSIDAFSYAVNNTLNVERKTTLKDILLNNK